VVGYEHGLSVPPAGGKQIALALAKDILTGSPADDQRATTMTTDEQSTTFYVPGRMSRSACPRRTGSSHTLRTGIASARGSSDR
jgi:hypothetical protein